MELNDIEKQSEYNSQKSIERNKPKKLSVDAKAKKEMNERMKEWARESKIHGIDRLVISRSLPIKIIWFVFLIALTAISLYLVAKTVTEYLRFDVKTTSREIFVEQIPFPRVTVCNSNPMVTRAANDYVRNYLKSTFNVNVSSYQDVYAYQKSGLIPNDTFNYLIYSLNYMENTTLRRSFGYNYIDCEFNSIECVLNKDIFDYYDPNFGNCFLFNPSTYLNGTKRDIYNVSLPFSGFVITMLVGVPQPFIYETASRGLVIKVDDQESVELFSIDALVAPGTDSLFLTSLTITQTQPRPYSDCIQGVVNPITTLMNSLNISYSRTNCLIVCQQKVTIDTFKCQNMQLPLITSLNAIPACESESLYEIINYLNLSSNCLDSCPIECASKQYDFSISSLEYPTFEEYFDIVSANYSYYSQVFGTDQVTYDMFKDSVATLGVVFKQIKYTETVEMPSMTAVDLVSNIGGTMGLFIGFSIMLFVEFIELAIEFLIFSFKNFCRRKPN